MLRAKAKTTPAHVDLQLDQKLSNLNPFQLAKLGLRDFTESHLNCKQHKQLGFAYHELGQHYLKNQNYVKAYKYLVQAIAILESNAIIRKEESFLELIRVYYDFSVIHLLIKKERQLFDKLEKLLLNSLQKLNCSTHQCNYALASVLIKQGQAYLLDNNSQLFFEFHSAGIQIYIEMAKNKKDKNLQLSNAIHSFQKIIDPLIPDKKVLGKTECLYLEKLEKDCIELSILFSKNNEYNGSAYFGEKALALICARGAKLEFNSYHILISSLEVSYYKFGHQLLQGDSIYNAELFFKKALDITNLLVDAVTDQFSGLRAEISMSLAFALMRQAKHQSALKIVAEQEKKFVPVQYKYNLIFRYILTAAAEMRSLMVEAELQNGNIILATVHAEISMRKANKAQALLSIMEERTSIDDKLILVKDGLSNRFNVIADVYQKESDFLSAIKYYEKAIECCNPACQEKMSLYYRQLAWTLGYQAEVSKNSEEAKDYIARSVQALHKISVPTKEDDDFKKYTARNPLTATMNKQAKIIKKRPKPVELILANKTKLESKITELGKLVDKSSVATSVSIDSKPGLQKTRKKKSNYKIPHLDQVKPIIIENNLEKQIAEIVASISALQNSVAQLATSIKSLRNFIETSADSNYKKKYLEKVKPKNITKFNEFKHRYKLNSGILQNVKGMEIKNSADSNEKKLQDYEKVKLIILADIAHLNELENELQSIATHIKKIPNVKIDEKPAPLKKETPEKKLNKAAVLAEKRRLQDIHKRTHPVKPKQLYCKVISPAIDEKKPISNFKQSYSVETKLQKNALNNAFNHLIKMKICLVHFDEELTKTTNNSILFADMRHYVLLLHITRIMQELKRYILLGGTSGDNIEVKLCEDLRNMLMHGAWIAKPETVLATAKELAEKMPVEFLALRKKYLTELVLTEKQQTELVELYQLTHNSQQYLLRSYPLVISETYLYKELARYHQGKVSNDLSIKYVSKEIFSVIVPKIMQLKDIIMKGYKPESSQGKESNENLIYYTFHFDALKMLIAIFSELSRHLDGHTGFSQRSLILAKAIRDQVGHYYKLEPQQILSFCESISQIKFTNPNDSKCQADASECTAMSAHVTASGSGPVFFKQKNPVKTQQVSQITPPKLT